MQRLDADLARVNRNWVDAYTDKKTQHKKDIETGGGGAHNTETYITAVPHLSSGKGHTTVVVLDEVTEVHKDTLSRLRTQVAIHAMRIAVNR